MKRSPLWKQIEKDGVLVYDQRAEAACLLFGRKKARFHFAEGFRRRAETPFTASSGDGTGNADFPGRKIRFRPAVQEPVLPADGLPESDDSGKVYHSDAQIEDLLRYINSHLTEDLSAEVLAGKYYISKYHLMRKFKEETGYTLHQYVLSKRLVCGRSLITEGIPVTKAAALCGFGDYTTFVRAYKKQFRGVPGDARYLTLPETEENEE